MMGQRFRPVVLGAILVLIAGVGRASALNPNHDCAFCHDLHTSAGQDLLQAATAEATCRACHDPATGTATVKAEIHTNKVGSSKAAFNITCTVCHTPHSSYPNWVGGTNLKLVGRNDDGSGVAKIQTPNSGLRYVTFESRGTDGNPVGPSLHSFADNDEDGNAYYDGVCETCHTDTSNHENGTIAPDLSNHLHERGKNCMQCHPHEESFWGSGGSCDACHNAPQDNSDGLPTWQSGRREIVSEFARASTHLSGTLNVADCEICHLQDSHQQGVVRLKNPDNPTSATPIAVLNGGVDPLASPAEAAKLTAFCLACHDADGYDGANATLPFTTGATPPDVSTSWTTASHNTIGSLTCFGNGTTGCHGSGHGSAKRKLLAPADVAPTAPANTEEEEGFCFNCHDADGPSSIDANSGFATPILTADNVTQFGRTFNDRHDVQYAAQVQSGAKIECTDCHDPHQANSAQPWKSDPDPTDGRVPGTNWFEGLAGAGLGVDAYTEFCLDCHDGSFAPGVSGHSDGPLVDILNASWLVNSHGAGPSGGALKSGYGGGEWALDDVLPCWACHQAHPDDVPQPVTPSVYNNLFQMKQVITAKDGVTQVPADDAQGLNYEVTTLTARRNDNVNSYYLCNTCHTSSMGSGKQNCSDCHVHSDNRF